MKTKLLLITFLLIMINAAAAQEKAQLDRWHGLILEESTYEDAERILGKPVKDKVDQMFVPLMYSKWFGNKPPKGFREVKFKGIDGMDSVTLYFRENKLLVIEMDMKKELTASTLINAYENRFVPLVGNYGAGVSPSELETQTREIEYRGNFPLGYFMGSATKKSIGLAMASVGGLEAFASGMNNGMSRGAAGGGYNLGGDLPGLVRKLQLISRTLENRQGVELLK